MATALLSPPAIEPVTLAEAKAHLRVDGSDEDALIESLIVTSRLHVEAALGLALIAQSWRVVLDCWPFGDTVELPVRPLVEVTAIRVRDGNGTASEIDPLGYAVDAVSNVPRLISRSGWWPMPGARKGGIEIDFDVGFGATAEDVPKPIRQALLMLIAHWYENREPAAAGSAAARIPATVSSVLEPYRLPRL